MLRIKLSCDQLDMAKLIIQSVFTCMSGAHPYLKTLTVCEKGHDGHKVAALYVMSLKSIWSLPYKYPVIVVSHLSAIICMFSGVQRHVALI